MIVLLMMLAAGLVREVPAQAVPLWGCFETGVVNSRSYANPFTGVTLIATVEASVKRTFSCPDKRDWVLHLSREE